MKKNILILVSILFFKAGLSQNLNDNIIVWQDNILLGFDDFRGKPNINGKIAAISCTNIECVIMLKNDSVEFYVTAIFFKDSSWIRSNRRIKSVLDHEQMHFNLTELYAREFRKYLSTQHFEFKLLNYETRNKIYYSIEPILKRIIFLLNEEQNRFDITTDYSENLEELTKWNEMQNRVLKELDSYSSKIVKLRIIW